MGDFRLVLNIKQETMDELQMYARLRGMTLDQLMAEAIALALLNSKRKVEQDK